MGMLPVGTRVHVATFDGREYNGLVKGYDPGKTKYQVSPEIFKDSGEFAKSLTNWAFPMEVEELVWDIMENSWVSREYWNKVNPK